MINLLFIIIIYCSVAKNERELCAVIDEQIFFWYIRPWRGSSEKSVCMNVEFNVYGSRRDTVP